MPLAYALTLPIGTQVVTRVALPAEGQRPARPRGAVGVVVAAPGADRAAYVVRFPDGAEAALLRADLAIRKQVPRDGVQEYGADVRPERLYAWVIYRCVIGSRAYGLDEDGSDIDRRGIYLPPAELHWSLAGVPEQLEHPETRDTYWELQKFLTMALKANPNVLECLYSPLVEVATPAAQELLAARGAFLSQQVYQTYNGYVLSQFAKLERDLRTGGAIRWKHAMHLIRLLLSGITVLREGFVPLEVAEHRERLLAIRRGQVPWPEVDAWRLALHRRFDEAARDTRLPERPDYAWADGYLRRARRGMVDPG